MLLALSLGYSLFAAGPRSSEQTKINILLGKSHRPKRCFLYSYTIHISTRSLFGVRPGYRPQM
jgi:hypothetical protein